MCVYLLMMMEVEEVDYSEVLSYKAFRRCSVFGAGGVHSSYALVKTSTAELLDLYRAH